MTASAGRRRATAQFPIWLVRHASTSWTGRRWCGRADPPLTAAGRLAASELAGRLAAELPPDAIVITSPARRARSTAEAIAAAAGQPVIVEPLLVEVDVGRIEGLAWGELSTREPAFAEALASAATPLDWPGGESASDVAERADSAAERIRAIAAGRPTLIVSHGAFLHALGPALGGEANAIPLEPCGVTRIRP